jgi:GT2 family glycosyltransferase
MPKEISHSIIVCAINELDLTNDFILKLSTFNLNEVELIFVYNEAIQLSSLIDTTLFKEIKLLAIQSTDINTLKKEAFNNVSGETVFIIDNLNSFRFEQNTHFTKFLLSANEVFNLAETNSTFDELNNQYIKALTSIQNLETRIKKYETTSVFIISKKMKLFLNKIRSNAAQNSNNSNSDKLLFVFKKSGRKLIRKAIVKVLKNIYLQLETKNVYIKEILHEEDKISLFADTYQHWLNYHQLDNDKLMQFTQEIWKFSKQPKFSILLHIENNNEFLHNTISSVVNQLYPNWELILVSSVQNKSIVNAIIDSFQENNTQFLCLFNEDTLNKVVSLNEGLKHASGDFTLLVKDGDELTKDALFQFAKSINLKENTDLIYSDEDTIDENNHLSLPIFKPDWCPDNLLSRFYLGNVICYKTSLLKSIDGWKEGYDDNEEFDLALRFTEQTDSIIHVPTVTYHNRISATNNVSNVNPSIFTSGKKTINDAITRRGETGKVDVNQNFSGYTIRYDLVQKDALISIIIPTKDQTVLLKKCIESIFERSTYRNFEIILIDNNSEEKEFFDFVKQCESKYNNQFNYVRAEIPFNFSKLMNIGAENANGSYLVLLNNDTEVITPDWLEGMLEQAQRKSIGVVGVKLLYPNNTIQHAGVIMGIGGVVDHVFVGDDRFGPGYLNYINNTTNYSALTAACVMVKTSVFNEVNGFEELFTIEYNDVDFCLKVKEKGYNNIYVPHVELFHYESISRGHPYMTKESYNRHVKEMDLIKSKWMKYIKHDPCYNPNLSINDKDFGIRI